jgi:ATP-dependent RNA helicase DeaD
VPVRRSDYVSDRAFADFPISSDVLSGLAGLGYVMATPVQAMMIDPALAGKDLLVRAKTGTGKTAAFCVPVVERITAGTRQPRAIVLEPTRELAIQVAQECTGIAKFKDLRIAAIYGGVGFPPQEQALRDGVEIVIGTPGRILDHIKRGNLDLSGVQVAVLDEADEMLSMGFLEDVRKILDRTPKARQNLLVSATINESLKGLIRSYLKDPEEIYLSVDGDNVGAIAHILYETSPDYHKARALLDLIEQERPNSAIIFCNTREDVNTVYTFLDRQGLGVEMISGELAQARREKVMARVKAGAVQFLVSTDVAARGIDISGLSHVINYALPDDASIYLHRCGRTGRIGNTGTAITLAGGGDFSTRLTLERLHKIVFEVKALPTPAQSKQLQADRIARSLKEAAGTMAFEAYIEVARALRERPDADQVLAVALRGFFQWDRARRAAAAEEADAASGEPRNELRDDRAAPRREERGRDDRGRDRDAGRGRDRDGRGRDRDRPAMSDRGDRPAMSDRGDRPAGERSDRGDRPAMSDRGERPAGERSDRPERAPRGDRPERGERTDRGERTERGERTAHADRPADGERGGERPANGERGERPANGERGGRGRGRGERIGSGERIESAEASPSGEAVEGGEAVTPRAEPRERAPGRERGERRERAPRAERPVREGAVAQAGAGAPVEDRPRRRPADEADRGEPGGDEAADDSGEEGAELAGGEGADGVARKRRRRRRRSGRGGEAGAEGAGGSTEGGGGSSDGAPSAASES